MIQISGAEGLIEKTRIVYNPVSELSYALDLLCHPEHHPLHLSWAGGVRNRLTDKEKKLLEAFETRIEGYLNLDLYFDFLASPFGLDAASSACSIFFRDEKHWIDPTDRPALSTSERESLVSFLLFVWESYILPVVIEHLPILEEQREDGVALAEEKGDDFFCVVSDRILRGKNGVMKIEKWVESAFHAEELEKFYIELSLFAFPHLIISDRHEAGCFFLSWDVPFRGDDTMASGIDRISLKAFALSDKSRLRILLMLTETSLTQKELSRLMGFAKSTISRHINILIEAGFILPLGEEGERNVKLRLNRGSLAAFSGEIDGWLGN